MNRIEGAGESLICHQDVNEIKVEREISMQKKEFFSHLQKTLKAKLLLTRIEKLCFANCILIDIERTFEDRSHKVERTLIGRKCSWTNIPFPIVSAILYHYVHYHSHCFVCIFSTLLRCESFCLQQSISISIEWERPLPESDDWSVSVVVSAVLLMRNLIPIFPVIFFGCHIIKLKLWKKNFKGRKSINSPRVVQKTKLQIR